MRLGAFCTADDPRVRPGLFTAAGRVVDVEAELGPGRPLWWLTEAGLARCRALDAHDGTHDAAHVTFAAAVPWPGKVIAAGRNYLSHVREGQKTWAARGREVQKPAFPSGFVRVASSLVGHGAPILLPPGVGSVDYELELAVVIGRKAVRVGEAQALDHVAGYCLCNDVSARTIQLAEMESLGILLAKNFPTFGPLGPWVTTAEEIGDPQDLDLELSVNGDVRQAVNTSEMLFGVAELVAYWSQMGLQPGDVLITGTPAGVALSRPDPERFYLHAGDVVRLTGSGLGELVNPVAQG